MKHILIVVAALGVATPAFAQMDFLNAGKSALGSLAGGTPGGGGNASLGQGLSDGQISSGLKEALRVGTEKAVATVGRPGGFLNDSRIHIPLPGPLERVKSSLAMVGASGMADDLERKMNEAAETAAPKAARIFGNAVGRMSIADARGILTGPSDSATQYFKRTTSQDLTVAMTPIVQQSLSSVGALSAYNSVMGKVQSLPFGSATHFDLNSYVVSKALDGIFFYLARQEEQIRANPAARTTDLLRTVFK